MSQTSPPASAHNAAREIVDKLSLSECCSLLVGSGAWRTKSVSSPEIPSVLFSDGPHGVRMPALGAPGTQTGGSSVDHLGLNASVPATCFPSAVSLASTWDNELVTEIGLAIRDECIMYGIDVVLGPGLNIKRNPLCGRNFEYFSEDPHLTGAVGAALVQGIQAQGYVGACIKHFCANNQERRRMVANSIISERVLREIYLPGFEKCIASSRPVMVMGAYNRVNGTYACESKELLTHILREEWGFEGAMVSDWYAIDDRVKAVLAGLDLEMPGGSSRELTLLRAATEDYRKYGVTKEELEKAIRVAAMNIVYLGLKVKESKRRLAEDPHILTPATLATQKEAHLHLFQLHHELAVRAAGASMVLLRNDTPPGAREPLLPVSNRVFLEVGIIGALAGDKKAARYQGGGSSFINMAIAPLTLREAWERRTGRSCRYAPGYSTGQVPNAAETNRLIAEAVKLAMECPLVLLHLGLPSESEGADRDTMDLPQDQIELCRALLNAGCMDKVVVLLTTGAPVTLEGWSEYVRAILLMHLGGQGVYEAAVNILRGNTNPSGRLAESWAAKLEDYASSRFYSHGSNRGNFPTNSVVYGEGLRVGYRDRFFKPVFPFGHGLSYTTFEVTHFEFDVTTMMAIVSTRNTGTRPGKAVVQIYVRGPLGVEDATNCPDEPKQKLVSYIITKELPSGDSEPHTVFTQLNLRDFTYWDESLGSWRAPGGEYEVMAGFSSEHIVWRERCSISPRARVQLATIDISPFKKPENSYPKVHRNTTLYELATFQPERFEALRTKFMPQLFQKFPELASISSEEIDTKNQGQLLIAFIAHAPIRNLCNGKLTDQLLDQVIDQLNSLQPGKDGSKQN